jgi:hypothetical protein
VAVVLKTPSSFSRGRTVAAPYREEIGKVVDPAVVRQDDENMAIGYLLYRRGAMTRIGGIAAEPPASCISIARYFHAPDPAGVVNPND